MIDTSPNPRNIRVMPGPRFLRLAADLLQGLHFTFILFVVGGLILVVIGGSRKWSWVRNRTFRLLHLAAIGIVVVQSWFGVTCILTDWESALRERAGDATYSESFVAYWLNRWMYIDAPAWVFVVAYTLFGGVVVLTFLWRRTRPVWRRSERA